MGLQIELVVPSGNRFPGMQAELVVLDELRVLVVLGVARRIECRGGRAELITASFAQRRHPDNNGLTPGNR